MKPISLDEDLVNSDWLKTAWDLPPYNSKEFMEQVPNLDWFRTSAVYQAACVAGLIHDDEWVGEYLQKDKPTAPKPRKSIYIHL